MVSGFSQEQLAVHIQQILGDVLSERAIRDCINALEIIEPPIAKQFWQGTTAKPGIYIVLSGKVRLLDSSNNLINTLTAGESFGELTLFPEQQFSNYVARASVNLKVAYLPQKTLNKIMGEFPGIYGRLLNKAQIVNTNKSPEAAIIPVPKAVKNANFSQPIIIPVTLPKSVLITFLFPP